MEILQIERTDNTPKIVFDPDEFMFVIRGASRPENARKFYEPILTWLEGFTAQLPSTSQPLSVEVKLKYFNSASMNYLNDIFRLIAKIHNNGKRILIDWYTEEDDDVMRQAGQELSELSGLPFNFIEE
ncbi:MAG: DUF1987 domain-containing protein [Bacteroidales bacterium]|nr:DUF1987 domain-containing protein [Bacteroidales bacterium]